MAVDLEIFCFSLRWWHFFVSIVLVLTVTCSWSSPVSSYLCLAPLMATYKNPFCNQPVPPSSHPKGVCFHKLPLSYDNNINDKKYFQMSLPCDCIFASDHSQVLEALKVFDDIVMKTYFNVIVT